MAGAGKYTRARNAMGMRGCNDVESGAGERIEKANVFGIGMARAKASGVKKGDAELRSMGAKCAKSLKTAKRCGRLDAGRATCGGIARGFGRCLEADAQILRTLPEKNVGRIAKSAGRAERPKSASGYRCESPSESRSAKIEGMIVGDAENIQAKLDEIVE